MDAASTPEHRVALVVDPNFGPRLVDLSARIHAWIVDSPSNHDAARLVWKVSNPPSLARGVTLFTDRTSGQPDEIAASILDTLELHHGFYSHSPPLSVVEIYGAEPTPRLTTALAALGFVEIQPSSGGCIARRSLPTCAPPDAPDAGRSQRGASPET